MKRRYILAPQAIRDLLANRVESVIRSKFVYLSEFPQAGHRRYDLTTADVRFFSIIRDAFFLSRSADARYWRAHRGWSAAARRFENDFMANFMSCLPGFHSWSCYFIGFG